MLWAARLRSWGIVCAGSRRFARIVRLVQHREGRLCLPARPRVGSLALGSLLVVRVGGRLARAPGLTRVLGLVVQERRHLGAARILGLAVRARRHLGVTRGLEAASMAIRCVVLRGGSVVLPARVCAGLARC